MSNGAAGGIDTPIGEEGANVQASIIKGSATSCQNREQVIGSSSQRERIRIIIQRNAYLFRDSYLATKRTTVPYSTSCKIERGPAAMKGDGNPIISLLRLSCADLSWSALSRSASSVVS